jgi:hypothetical protein
VLPEKNFPARRPRHATWPAIIALGVFHCAPALSDVPPEPAGAITAFVDVNVIPMDTERVLHGQTVLIENGTIAAIGASLAVPKNARVVDGHGKDFLSPGLADMHTHSDTAADMKVYLANGVTSVLNMGEASNGFMGQVRPAINSGKRPGPHIYAAFLVDGSPRYGHITVTAPDEARAIVRLAKTNGYEFIKVYNNLSPECFDALVDEGRRQQIPVVGHGVTRVGIERQLDAGQVMVAHTEEFLYTVFSKPDEAQTDAASDPARIPSAIAFVKRDRAFVTADLNTYATIARQWGKPEVVEAFMRQPEIAYLSPQWRIDWRGEDYASRKGSLSAKLAFLARFTKAMSDAGVPLITGTDAPTIPGLVPGYSLHDDLRALEQAGLTRFQALSAATRTPAELIQRSVPHADAFGTIAPGRRADLILSANNPLDDLSTLRKPLGVMANGNWYADSELQALLDGVASTYRRALTTE